MAMSLGPSGPQRANINMTPMIDILLVLIIIFMVITPITSRGLNALVPQATHDNTTTAQPNDDIVLTVNNDNTVSINQESVPIEALHDRLSVIFRNHNDHVIFLRGNKELQFHQIAEVIDIARGIGLTRIGLMTQ